MPRRERQLTRRHVKILALQRASKAISLVGREGLYMPRELDSRMQLEIDLELSEIGYRLRQRLANLSSKEWPQVEKEIFEDSDKLNLRMENSVLGN